MQEGLKKFKAKELFGSFSTLHDIQKAKVGYEFYWLWPKDVGTGYLSMIKFRPGLLLGVGDYYLSAEIEVDFLLQNPFWVMAFNVTKGAELITVDPSWTYEPGKSSFFYQPEWGGSVKLPVCSHISTVSIYISPSLLKTFLDFSQRPSLLKQHPVFKESRKQSYYQPIEMTATIKTAVDQILSCPYKGSMRRLYLEGKTMELLTYGLSQFFSPEALWKENHAISDEEVQLVHRAKEILCHDLQNPPKLRELARRVGLSHMRLNLYFREIFGTTSYGYLREFRLSRAKALLDEGVMNVTEVAYEVGYSSLSHFAKSFKDRHGVLPGTYARKAYDR